jgi:hypothetical protein
MKVYMFKWRAVPWVLRSGSGEPVLAGTPDLWTGAPAGNRVSNSPNSATDVGLAIAVVVACPDDASIRPALPRLTLPIILVPLISGLRLRSSIAATGWRQMRRHQLQSEL